MKVTSLIILVLTLSIQSALAGNDPSIKGDLRGNIQTAMNKHIDSNAIKGKFVIYDAVAGEMKQLTLSELHSGIVQKGDFYVSCADFIDASGKKYDLDFLVGETSSGLKVVQSIVHSIDGDKRSYHVEGS